MTKINVGDTLKTKNGDILIIDKKMHDDAPAYLDKEIIIYLQKGNLHFISGDLSLYLGQQLGPIKVRLKQVAENNRIIYVDDLAKVRLV